MIESEKFFFLYNVIYAFFASVVLLMAIYVDIKGSNKLGVKFSSFFSISLTIILILLVGFRSYTTGTDTINYYNYVWGNIDYFEVKSDLFFYYIMYFTKKLGFSYQYFLLTVSILFFTTIYFTYRKVSKLNNVNLLFVLFSLFSFFFCSSLSINVIRQGLSLVFLMLAYIQYYQANKKKNALICLILSVGGHLTVLIPIVLFLIVDVCKKIKITYFYYIYALGIVLAYIGYGIKDIAPFLSETLAEDNRTSYLSAEVEYYQIEFRINFAAFNTIFLLIFVWLNKINKSVKYELLLKYYILASFVFFMAFQIPYSDRWGLFSWIFIPILFSPIFSLNIQRKKLNTISVLFLIFIFVFFNVLYK
jgi:hypothetical protein